MADFSSSSHRQAGLAGSHLLGALLAILLLSWLVLDALTLYSLRVRLQHGLLHAARQASVHQARPETIAHSFSQTLSAAKVSPHDQWQLQILSPSPQAFRQHGRPSRQHAGRQAITQGWQALQHEQADLHGPSIYQANILHLYLLYAHKPGPLSLMRLLPKLPASVPNPLGSAAVWLRLEIKHPMQSDAVQWDDLADGRVVYAQYAENQAILPVSHTSWPATVGSTDTPVLNGDSSLPHWDNNSSGVHDGALPPGQSGNTANNGESATDPEAPNPACY